MSAFVPVSGFNDTTKWSTAINYLTLVTLCATSAFPAITSQNVCCEKGLILTPSECSF